LNDEDFFFHFIISIHVFLLAFPLIELCVLYLSESLMKKMSPRDMEKNGICSSLQNDNPKEMSLSISRLLSLSLTLSPSVNFTNFLLSALALVDPKSLKNTVKSSVSFYAFTGSACKKVVPRTLMKLSPILFLSHSFPFHPFLSLLLTSFAHFFISNTFNILHC